MGEAPSVLVQSDMKVVLQHGVPWHGKWDKPVGLLEFLAIACAPAAVVDSCLEFIPLADLKHAALSSALFQAVRCHRHHLLLRLLDALVEVPSDSKPVAIACYTKNVAGLKMLIEHKADVSIPCANLSFPTD